MYKQTFWKDHVEGVQEGTDLNAENLNNIETGITEVSVLAAYASEMIRHGKEKADAAATAASNAQSTADGKAPAYTYGTADLTAGSSQLETGKLYFVYE
jgi:hypothetical protein